MLCILLAKPNSTKNVDDSSSEATTTALLTHFDCGGNWTA